MSGMTLRAPRHSTEGTEDPEVSALVARSLQGDAAAWDDLYERHAASVYNFLAHRLHGDAAARDDLFQETLLRAVERLRQYDPTRGTFRGWLCAIALNLLRERGRSLRREAALLLEARDDGTSSEDPPPPAEDRGTLANLACSLLPARYQRALALKYQAHGSLDEVAREMAVTREAAGSLLYRAREAFKDAYRRLASKGGTDE